MSRLPREIMIAIGAGLAAGAIFWFTVAVPRRKAYEDFYKEYNAEIHGKRRIPSFKRSGH